MDILMSRITISMPVYNTPPEFVRVAVGSILNQTYTDWHLVVVNDGGKRPELPRDERITLFELPINRGRYFADAVVLRAIDGPWWTPHDSDDYSDPYRLEFLLYEATSKDAAAATSPVTMQYEDGHWSTVKVKGYGNKGTLRTTSRYTAGLYRTDIAKLIGGPHPASRGSYDTAFTSLLWDAFPVAVVPHPLYHVVRRPDSLTTAPETRLATEKKPASPWRKEQKALRKKLYTKAAKRPNGEWADLLRARNDIEAEVDMDAAILRAVLK